MWSGPPVEQLLPWGQLAALDVLNAAVGIIPEVDSTNSTNARFGPVGSAILRLGF